MKPSKPACSPNRRSPGTRSRSRPCARPCCATSRIGAAVRSRCTTFRSPSLLGPFGLDLLQVLLLAQPDAERVGAVFGLAALGVQADRLGQEAAVLAGL